MRSSIFTRATLRSLGTNFILALPSFVGLIFLAALLGCTETELRKDAAQPPPPPPVQPVSCPSSIEIDPNAIALFENAALLVSLPTGGGAAFPMDVLPSQDDWDELLISEQLQPAGPLEAFVNAAWPNEAACPFSPGDAGSIATCGAREHTFRVGSAGAPPEFTPAVHNRFWDEHSALSENLSVLAVFPAVSSCVSGCRQTYHCDGRAGDQIGQPFGVVFRFLKVIEGGGGNRTDVFVKKYQFSNQQVFP